MNRVNDKPVKIGEKRSRYTFRVYDDPSEPDTMQALARQIAFLQEFVNQPSLLHAGPTYARKIAIWHNGTQWVLSGEAEADDV